MLHTVGAYGVQPVLFSANDKVTQEKLLAWIRGRDGLNCTMQGGQITVTRTDGGVPVTLPVKPEYRQDDLGTLHVLSGLDIDARSFYRLIAHQAVSA